MSANTSTLLSSSIEFKGFYATPPLTRIIMFLSVNPIQFPNPKLKPSQTPTPRLFPINFSLHTTQTPSKTRIRCRCRCSKSDQQTLPHSVIERIADKLRSLGITETENPTTRIADPVEESNRVGEIFVPYPNQLPKFRVGHTLDPSWSTPDNPVPKPGYGEGIVRYNELRERVERERKEGKGREDKVPSLAELKLPRDELRRLRAIGVKERRKLKVGKAGITEGIVNGIHERWRREEVVKIVCEDLCRQNMKRTHDLLERKTGGLVVWRSGSKIILYRGADYKYPYFLSNGSSTSVTTVDAAKSTLADDGDTGKVESSTSYTKDVQYYTKDVQYYTKDVQYSHSGPTNRNGQPTLVQGVGAPNRVRFLLPGEAQLAEEADRLLDGLGPRFTDWWGYDPLPVDADLLPAVVPGYRKPFRLLPFGIKAKLTDDEMTTLRRLGRPLPCHFALGRNRKLQGLAAAIVKLWEKSEIAKIAIKRGVQNTNSEIMTEELKWLTGGTLLSRDREFIVLYRGKDFLPQAVSSAIEERRRNVMGHIKYPNNVELDESADKSKEGITSHNLTNEADHHTTEKSNLLEQRKLTSKEAAIKQTERKLSRALEKKVHAEKLLSDLAKNEMPQKPDADKEGITEEERYMLRKIGLKMKAFLLMGRRGVFSGTIENMHLHWKYRELVKIICKETNFDDVYHDAQVLEAESGGILVAVERVSKGYAIIVYRGKNYTRPASLRPATLLSKREAMKRSLEAQRYKSLKLHVLELAKNIDELKLQLERDKESQKLQPSDETDSQVKDVTNSMELASPEKLESPLESKSLSSPVGVPPVEEDLEARDEHDEADMNSVGLSDELDASSEAAAPVQQDTFSVGSSVTDVVDISNRESESSFQLESMEHHESLFSDISFRADPMPSHLDETKSNAERPFSHQSSDDMLTNEAMTSTMESASNELKKSFLTVVKKVNPREIHLSNRDRLLLRKQALKMKKRPVLAVGRSNIVTGVAKAIKTHFKKHPLAIVNVKGRAKGTSVQELVFKLEQATGSVLVSQEPSKVILYRGWGADDELGHKGRKNIKDGKTMGDGTKTTVSPELIAAIRLECGLQEKQKENSVPTA